MSFGYSIGDFITLGDKAWTIYKKCKEAPEQYAQLSHYVEVLRIVIDDVHKFLEDGEPPDSERKLASLVSSAQGCETTLAEVEEFLEKHSKVGSKNKRVIDTARFIIKDVQGLRSRLEMNAQLLQLCLVSFQSLSIAVVRENLHHITDEYRSGTREPTVLSSVLLDNDMTRVDDEDLYEQIIVDLEGKGTHPDCITLHNEYIRGWIRDITLQNIQGEEADGATAITASDPTELAVVPETRIRSWVASTEIDSESKVSTLENIEVEVPLDCSSMPGSIAGLPSDDSGPSPPDQPNPEYVKRVLGSLLDTDRFLLCNSPDALPRIQRVYERLDYTQRGCLTRSEILKASQDALEYVGITGIALDKLRLHAVISTFDEYRVGKYDEQAFTSFVRHLQQLCVKARREQLAEIVTFYGAEARAYLDSERMHQIEGHMQNTKLEKLDLGSPKYIPPFGWSENAPGSTVRFRDNISGKDAEQLPLVHRKSFSTMASDAAWAVERIDIIQAEWLPFVPAGLRQPFLDGFNKVRNAGLKYTIFENDGDPYRLSDLDDFAVSYHIMRKLEPGTLPAALHPIMQDLEMARIYSFEALGDILAFVYHLARSLQTDQVVQRFSILNSSWRATQALSASRLILQRLNGWSDVVEATRKCRQINIAMLHNRALSISQESLRCQLSEVLFESTLLEMSISGLKPSKLFWSSAVPLNNR
ncbi:hypothetical protein VFPFJ_11057 [Purpureocillium lilacinum]|uniref:Uncharacterized protein n=1 Tax=Purpureocillium lilacinum TaxID=33203 RepID=A0A179G0T4_PURLI|nr:hypothetical protein VFPFJ_11057 [Purpureocillium lilacinum]OAQ71516.1 hypothetical protein VFPFJ_11057 [Purpureocillium lilacinum]